MPNLSGGGEQPPVPVPTGAREADAPVADAALTDAPVTDATDAATDVLVKTPAGATTGVRVLAALGAALALLLIGAAAGLLVAQSRPSPDPTAPAPDSVAVGFCQDMTVHHRQAVRMAGIARALSTDPAVRQIAFDVETGQIEQIGRMQGWLNIWGRDPQPVGGYMAWMADASPGHGHSGSTTGPAPGGTLRPGAVAQMPGMASDAELTKLGQLTGRDLDIFFMQLMLRHHQGGQPMMRYAADHAESGVVRNLAAQMIIAQTMDIDLLTDLLAERGAAPLPAPS